MKPDLIMLHGALGCKAQFVNWITRLSQSYNCHAYDLAGHGERSHEPAEFDIEKFSDDLKQYVTHHALKQPAVLGYSMGGYIALYTALRHPGLLGRIMTIATKFDWSPETARREAGYLQPALMWEKVPQLVQQLRSRHGSRWEAVVEKTAKMMLALGQAPPLDKSKMAEIDTPVKFCVGDMDKMVSVQETFDMYKAAGKNGRLCVLPRTGHLSETMPLDKIIDEARAFFQGDTEPK